MGSINPAWFTGIIDLSHNDEHPVDWSAVKNAGIVAALHKATEGGDWSDPLYIDRRNAAKAEGLLWGSFHFAGAIAGTGKKQADFYLDTTTPTEDEFVCFDCEKHGTFDDMERFVERVYERLGRYPAVYGRRLLRQLMHGNGSSKVARGVLWYDEYPPPPYIEPRQPLPEGWQRWTLWQYTDGKAGPDPKNTPGAGNVDRSVFQGTAQQLRDQWPFVRKD